MIRTRTTGVPAAMRRRILRELISVTVARTEADLLRALRGRGITVAQATISRDLAVLGAARTRTLDGWRYGLPRHEGEQAIRELALLEILSIAANESVILVRTRVGHAPGVGVFLDTLACSDILGTVAGNDTVIVVPDSHQHLPRLLEFLRRLVYTDKEDDVHDRS